MIDGLFVLGTSHRVAAAHLRERIQSEAPRIRDALARLTASGSPLEEAALLATCGRFEIYGVAEHAHRVRRLLMRLAHRAGEDDLTLGERRTYFLHGSSAAEHLFNVAAGLDSAVKGEAQILGQVRDVIGCGDDERTLGPRLRRLFQSAVATGKRVRSETEIGRGAASLAGASLHLLRQQMESLEGVPTLVLGAGETGTLAAHLLAKAGCRVSVANRTPERAERLAGEVGGEVYRLDELPAILSGVELVVGTVGSRASLIGPADLDRVEASGGVAPRYFLDLAHPRNFAPELADRSGTVVMDLDFVHRNAAHARRARESEVPQAVAIVEEELERFVAWYRGRSAVPRLRAVRDTVLSMAASEAERYGRGLDDDERERLDRFARALARTLLHQPTVALRDADPGTEEGRQILETAGVLFGIDA
ncbi:MAG: glutamyl-tRNA reductase [Longimicrobiales bacterium]|nr:glutamyl-tRNA reductase [Longimicrobiales bacterium]